MTQLTVLFEDNHIIAINKRCGDIVQGDKTGDKTLGDDVKEYLKEKYNHAHYMNRRRKKEVVC